jgi:hypothetical protein
MCDELVKPCVVSSDKSFASFWFKNATAGTGIEAGLLNHSGVDCGDDRRINDGRTKRFHDVQSQRRASMTGLMVQTPPRIKSFSQKRNSTLLGEHGISRKKVKR